MIKSLAALAIFALLGGSLAALPGVAPRVHANQTAALAKGDRLAIRPVPLNCSGQNWPNIETSCLRYAASGAVVREARLVTARR
jgi:hypothetical protein